MTKRLSLTLEADDETTVAAFTDPTTPEYRALTDWASEHGHTQRARSEAALLRLLIRAGADALHEQVLDEGYTELAALYGPDEQAEDAALVDDYAAHVDAQAAP